MLASHVPCQNSWLGQFLQLAASIASWYFCVLVLFVSWKPGVPLHSWGRAEASCWQGRRMDAVWVLWALLSWALEMNCRSSKLLFQVQSIKGIGLHIWLS